MSLCNYILVLYGYDVYTMMYLTLLLLLTNGDVLVLSSACVFATEILCLANRKEAVRRQF